MNAPDDLLENRTFDEINLGDSESFTHSLTEEEIRLFAYQTGDVNPAHLDKEFAERGIFHRVIAHGMWSASLLSTVLGTKLPGPGTIYLGQDLKFRRPVVPGDVITARVTVTEKKPEKKIVVLDCECVNQKNEAVLTGRAEVIAPSEKVVCRRPELPTVRVSDEHDAFAPLIARAAAQGPMSMAVAYPCDTQSLLGAVESARAGLIRPVLIGPRAKLEAVARAEDMDLSAFDVIDVATSHAAAEEAVRLAREGKVDALMKGSLHTDDLMGAVVSREGIRTTRRISHVFVMRVPTCPRPLLITDAAVNIQPTLEEKADIIQNAIDLAHALGIERPKVAILAAVETVTAKMQSTLDAAALCKMADRKQIVGADLDGPLAFDNAISFYAAQAKKIESRVAGAADILVVPNLDAGNMLAKQLEYLADAQPAGVVLGARVPIVLTSRADKASVRLASCAVASLFAGRPNRAEELA